MELQQHDEARLELLDRIEERVPELDLDAQPSIEWHELPDGTEALAVNGGAVDGGPGALFCNHGEDLHAYGAIMPIAPAIGCVVIEPGGGRYLAGVCADPLAQQ
jgi:hypothetical protein